MRFGSDDRGSLSNPRRKPPPNYFARSVQWKVFMLVALFVGVLALMEHARKPETWQWMWRMQGPASDSDHQAVSREQESLVRDALAARSSAPSLDEGSTSEPLVTSTPRPSTTALPGLRSSEVGPSLSEHVQAALLDAWDQLLRQLAPAQRDLLQQGLWQYRHSALLTPEQREAWPALVSHLQTAWDDYRTRAFLSVAQDDGLLTPQQKRRSVEVMEQLQTQWQEQSAALAHIGQHATVPPSQVAALQQLQMLLDQRAWAQIEDNAALRSVETDAWYRCWEKLASLSPEQLAQAQGPLSYVQLFSQPKEYRGQLVKIQGTARWGYGVRSREKKWGIDGYAVLGILPGSVTNSPLVVYCRELPAGFPAVESAGSSAQGVRLDEDVEVTGYFFKRWLHASGEGMSMSPLILGRITKWRPQVDAGRVTAEAPLPLWKIGVAVLSTAVLGCLLALLAFRSSRWSGRTVSASTLPPTQLPAFDQAQVQSRVAETLRDIARDDPTPQRGGDRV